MDAEGLESNLDNSDSETDTDTLRTPKFETSKLFTIIQEKSMSTPEKALVIINDFETDVNLRSNRLETYLHIIAHAYKLDDDAPCLLPVVFQLSNAGIETCAVDQDGNTSLHIAAKGRFSRRLLRALLMIGVDPTIENKDGETAIQMARKDVDNDKILSYYYPGMWKAVEHSSVDTVNVLLAGWCVVNYSRNDVFLEELASNTGDFAIIEAIQQHSMAISYVHFALAGDRQRLRPFFHEPNMDKNTSSGTFIDAVTGDFITMPLFGEVALLGLTAVVRKMIRKKCDFCFDVNGKPFILYMLENMPKDVQEFAELFNVIIDKTDISKYEAHTAAFLDAAFEKKLPFTVLSTMAAKGLDLFATDEHGHFLRDRIQLRSTTDNQIHTIMELKYVDDIIVHLAKQGCIDYLQMLGENFYQYVAVENRDGVRTLEALIKAVGPDKASEMMSYISAIQTRFVLLVDLIKADDITQFKQLANKRMDKVRDPHGRSLVHYLVIHGRHAMLGFYIQMFLPSINKQDKAGRTPLFWACALEDGDDTQKLLTKLGCSMNEKDKAGVSPIDVKLFSRKKKDEMLLEERTKGFRVSPGNVTPAPTDRTSVENPEYNET